MKAIFVSSCVNCGGPVSDERLLLGLPCQNCLGDSEIPRGDDVCELHLRVGEALERLGRLHGFRKTYELARAFAEFLDLFRRATRAEPWSAQKEWMRRVLKGASFPIVAPTGMGKTLFGMVACLYFGSRTRRCYLVMPTHILVEDVFNRACLLADNARVNAKILRFHSKMPRRERQRTLEAVRNADYNILITTSMFLARNFDVLRDVKFDFIFVDDVDAVLKASRNIDRLLMLLGFDQHDLERAYRRVELKAKMVRADGAAAERIAGEIASLADARRPADGVLVLASATARPRGRRARLFRELLNFEIGSAAPAARNVQDFYVERTDRPDEQIVSLVKRLGGGGIVFVCPQDGEDLAERIVELLRREDIAAAPYYGQKASPESIEKFRRGEVDVIIGMETYYGMLVRGFDLPERIRYAIHTDIPKFVIDLGLSDASPRRLYFLLSELLDYFPKRFRQRAANLARSLKRRVLGLEGDKLETLRELLVHGGQCEQLAGQLELCRAARDMLVSIFSDEEFLRTVAASPYVCRRTVDGKPQMVIPDVRTYIQASGRTSRMFPGGVTKGISVVLSDDERLVKALEARLRWYFDDVRFRSLQETDLDRLIEEVDRDRRLVRLASEGVLDGKVKDPVKSALLIVESPHKADTIARFFGRPGRRTVGEITVHEVATGDYLLNVAASKGHVFDLVEEGGFHGVLVEEGRFIPLYGTIKKCRRCGWQFVSGGSCPKCGSDDIDDAGRRLDALRDIAQEVDVVFVGTDPDREGEKIAWDIATSLSPFARNLLRLEFHEVTRPALRGAIDNPRSIDERRVDAQIVRRIEDRWLGFELSKRLWEAFGNKSLSAGRVQTPVLGWIIKRYDEYRSSWRHVGSVTLENDFRFECAVGCEPRELERHLASGSVRIERSVEEDRQLNPPPPFATDDLLSEASRVLKLSAEATMRLAQGLFEAGFITYHRTDSNRVSVEGIQVARDYIISRFSEGLFQPRQWGTKTVQGAHECIRATKPLDVSDIVRLLREAPRANVGGDHLRLYGLIFRRFIASQMTGATVAYQKALLRIGPEHVGIEFPVEIKEEGFLRVMPLRVYGRLSSGEVSIRSYEVRRRPAVMPFTQGELIREMRERGIGRPSTYAVIVQKILDRKYAIERNGRLIPTRLGRRVFEYLSSRFGEITSEEVTRALEKKMDEVESGLDPNEVLKSEFDEVRRL